MPMGHHMDMPMDCKAMMEQHDQMQAKMKEADARLQKLVSEMNAARGSKKTDATAAVVAELVAQHQDMHQDMEQMMPKMSQHMMQHMQGAMAQGMKGAMDCPMMKGQAAPPPPAEPHQ